MDPCPFVRVLVGNLALRMPVAPPAAGAGAGVHPSTSPCYCKIRLGKMPVQTVPAPLVVSDGGEQTPASGALAAARRPFPARFPMEIQPLCSTAGLASAPLRSSGIVAFPSSRPELTPQVLPFRPA